MNLLQIDIDPWCSLCRYWYWFLVCRKVCQSCYGCERLYDDYYIRICTIFNCSCRHCRRGWLSTIWVCECLFCWIIILFDIDRSLPFSNLCILARFSSTSCTPLSAMVNLL